MTRQGVEVLKVVSSAYAVAVHTRLLRSLCGRQRG